MIKCNRCGNMTPAGPMCQLCGAPLSSKNDAGFSQRMDAQEQSELPAWLGSLRVGERPAPPVDGSSNFSTADFMDEGPLPSWMRSERAEASDPSIMPMGAPEHLPAFSGQAPDGGTFPPNGLAAQSLIDEKSLPSWMKEGKQTPPSSPGSLSASSLLQQDDVPDWMKTLQQQPNATQPSYQERAGQFEQPAKPAASFSSDLGPGFSARDLLDQQALPSWMKSPGERNTAAPQADPFEQNGRGAPLQQSGLSASSLLDVDSLPHWMSEGGRDSRPNAAPPQPVWPTQTSPTPGWPESNTPSNQGWSMGQTPPMSAPQPMQTNSGQGGNVPASSFVDANALPEWLRNAADQHPQAAQQSQPGLQRQGPYANPPRVENVRVPSRPRGNEPGASESSEVAANVFASMLGVASTTSNQPQGSYQQPAQASEPGQMGQPAMPSGSFPGPRAVPNTPQGVGGTSPYPPANTPANTLGTPGAPGSLATSGYGNSFPGNTPGNNPGYGNSYPRNNPGQIGNPASMGSSYYPGIPPSQPMSQSAEMNGDQKNAKKRGLFGAFLDWLSR